MFESRGRTFFRALSFFSVMSDTASNEKSIAGAASIIGSATVLSRLLGYVRDASVAYVFGAAMSSDAFFVAFRISNLLRRLVGEGALTSSFVPIFTEELGLRDHEGSRRLSSSVFTLFFFILVALAALGIIFSDPLVRLLSPGFGAYPEKFALTVRLTRLTFPYMVAIGLMAIAMGVLHSKKHFTAPALSPVLFNIAIITSIFAVAPFLDEPVYALAIGVLAGGVLQFLLQLPFLKGYGFLPRPSFSFADPAIKRIFLLMGPAALGMGVYQLNIFVTLWFASRLAEGSVSYLFYASRLMELPLGVFGVAVSTAVLPNLSEHAARGDMTGFRGSISYSVRIVNFVIIPATAGLMVLNYPIVETLFGRGAFGAEAVEGTAYALYFYALGLAPIAVSRVFVSVFYSVKDTTTPLYIGVFSLVTNAVLSVLLVGPMGHGGLALATSVAAAVNFAGLVVVMRRRFGALGGRAIGASALKALTATVAMAVVVYLASARLYPADPGTPGRAAALAACLVAGVLTYLAVSIALRSPEVPFIKGFLRKRG